MNNTNIIKAFKLIENNIELSDFIGSINSELILKAEEILNLKFPYSYKQFLSKYGAGDINGFEIYGIIDSDFINSSIPDAIWCTLDERKNGLPSNLIVIASLGDGNYYVINTNVIENSESPIYIYTISGELEFIYEDFSIFLLSEIKKILGDI